MEDGQTLRSSHSRRKAKRAAQKKVLLRPILEEMRVSMCGSQRRCNEREMVRELVYNHEPTQAFGDGGSGIFLPSAFCEWLWILVEDVKRY